LGNFCKNSPNPKNFYLFISPLDTYQAVFFFNARRINATARIEGFSPHWYAMVNKLI